MSLPSSIIVVLAHFEPLFTAPTWKKVRMLLVGTLLARGRRNVTTVLQQMGHQMNPQFSVFHHVLIGRAGRRWKGAGDSCRYWWLPLWGQETQSRVGPSRSPSKRAGCIWEWKRNANGLTWRLNAAPPVSSDCTAWWCSWDSCCILMVLFLSGKLPGIPRRRLRSAISSPQCVGLSGERRLFRHWLLTLMSV